MIKRIGNNDKVYYSGGLDNCWKDLDMSISKVNRYKKNTKVKLPLLTLIINKIKGYFYKYYI